MAVYFDHAIQTPGPTSKALVHHDVEWHNSFSILAVASKNESTDSDGCVNFYLDEVKILFSDQSTILHNLQLWSSFTK